MKREQYYKNKRTGERTESHAMAMEWYRAKDEIEVWYWSEVCGEWLCGSNGSGRHQTLARPGR